MLKTSEYFNTLCKLLDKHHIRYCVAFGTLLGIVRENGFLKHDLKDLDFMIYDRIWLDCKRWADFLLEAKSLGITIECVADARYFCLWKGDVHADFHLLEDRIDHYCVTVTSKRYSFPRSIYEINKIEFNGTTTYVPRYAEDILTLLYGDWREKKTSGWGNPNANFVDNYEKIEYKYIISVEK